MMTNADLMTDTLPESARGVFSGMSTSGDPRGVRILARTIYRELRGAGMSEREVLAVATEMLAQTATDLKSSR
jgi:hypothetical protein